MNNVFENTRPLVVAEFGPEIDKPGRFGDLDQELWSAMNVPTLVPRPTAMSR